MFVLNLRISSIILTWLSFSPQHTIRPTVMLREFEDYMRLELNRSRLTVEAYSRDISQFAAWLGGETFDSSHQPLQPTSGHGSALWQGKIPRSP